jgi:hypothetical protein
VQPPLSLLYTGPFLVLERSLHFFKLQVGDKVDTVSCHRLKACHTPDDTTAAVPPKRGRPPAAQQPVAEPITTRRRQVSFAWPPASSKASKIFKNQYANCTRQESHAIVFAFVSPFRPPCPQRQAARAIRIIADSKVIKIQQTEL